MGHLPICKWCHGYITCGSICYCENHDYYHKYCYQAMIACNFKSLSTIMVENLLDHMEVKY